MNQVSCGLLKFTAATRTVLYWRRYEWYDWNNEFILSKKKKNQLSIHGRGGSLLPTTTSNDDRRTPMTNHKSRRLSIHARSAEADNLQWIDYSCIIVQFSKCLVDVMMKTRFRIVTNGETEGLAREKWAQIIILRQQGHSYRDIAKMLKVFLGALQKALACNREMNK